MSRFTYVPYDFPTSKDGEYMFFQEEREVLLTRREQLGLTQQQVADIAHIKLRQYQRLESGERHLSGCSMQIGLSICAALLLDPLDFVVVDVKQPDPATMKPVPTVDIDLPSELLEPRRPGRKPKKREMKVFLNNENYCLIIPEAVLDALGKPKYIKFLYNSKDNKIAIRACENADKDTDEVPELAYKGNPFVIYNPDFTASIRERMSWGVEMHAAKAQRAVGPNGEAVILVDPAITEITEDIIGPFAISH